MLLPLRLHDFRLIFAGESISLIGDQFHFIALAWLALQLTGSGLALGTVLMAAAIPRAVFMLLGGAMSDRVSPRSLMIISNALRAVVVALVAVPGADRQGRAVAAVRAGRHLRRGGRLLLPGAEHHRAHDRQRAAAAARQCPRPGHAAAVRAHRSRGGRPGHCGHQHRPGLRHRRRHPLRWPRSACSSCAAAGSAGPEPGRRPARGRAGQHRLRPGLCLARPGRCGRSCSSLPPSTSPSPDRCRWASPTSPRNASAAVRPSSALMLSMFGVGALVGALLAGSLRHVPRLGLVVLRHRGWPGRRPGAGRERAEPVDRRRGHPAHRPRRRLHQRAGHRLAAGAHRRGVPRSGDEPGDAGRRWARAVQPGHLGRDHRPRRRDPARSRWRAPIVVAAVVGGFYSGVPAQMTDEVAA